MIRKITQSVLAAICLVVFVPLGAEASVFHAAEKVALPVNDRISDNVYVGSQISVIGAVIDGDVVIGSGEATLEGEIGKDALIFGGTVLSKGKVSEDSRIIGGIITQSGSIGGDFVAIGGSIDLQRSGIVGGDALLIGNRIVLEGSIAGNTTIIAQQVVVDGMVTGNLKVIVQEGLELGPDAVIEGSLEYRSPKVADISNSESVRGDTNYIPINPGKIMASMSRGFFQIFGITILIGTAIAGLLIAFLFSGKVSQVLRSVEVSFWKKAGMGLLVMVLSPILLIGLAVSVIGGVVAIAGFLGLMLAMLATHVLSGIFLGAWLDKIVRPRHELVVTWQNALAGIVVLSIIGIVPIIGWIIKTIIFAAVLGALVNIFWKRGKELVARHNVNSRTV